MRRGGRRSQIEGRRGRRLFAVLRSASTSEVARAEPASSRSGSLTAERGERCTRRPNPTYTRIVTATVGRRLNLANSARPARDLAAETPDSAQNLAAVRA